MLGKSWHGARECTVITFRASDHKIANYEKVMQSYVSPFVAATAAALRGAVIATGLPIYADASLTSNSLYNRSSSVVYENFEAKGPTLGLFIGLSPPMGNEKMEAVMSKAIEQARSGLNRLNANETIMLCRMCDSRGLDLKMFEEKQPGVTKSKLTPADAAVLALYTAELSAGQSPYSECNSALRESDRVKCKPFVPFIWHVMHALAKCDRYEGTQVWRGVKADLSGQYPKDRELTWFQFSSCTCDIQVQQSEQFCGSSGTRTLFSIELTTGRARVITKFSLVPSEAEVLLPPNSRFIVVALMDAGNGLVIIHLRELPPIDPILEFDDTAMPSSFCGGSGFASIPSFSYPGHAVSLSFSISSLSPTDVAALVTHFYPTKIEHSAFLNLCCRYRWQALSMHMQLLCFCKIHSQASS
jgi:hypothetical protein